MTAAAHRVECARAEDFAASLPDGSVNLIATDGPYNMGKGGAAWDTWPSDDAFLEWMDARLVEWRRVLATNGTLYCFAPARPTSNGATMAARVEALVANHFRVLSSIVWVKPDPSSTINRGAGRSGQSSKEALRQWFPQQERVIMAEHQGTWDDAARAAVFYPLRAYLDGERQRAGIKRPDIDKAMGCQMAGHWFTSTQWELPTRDNYDRLRALFAAACANPLPRPFDDLHAEYERLHEDYTGRARRPFAVTPSVPYTDVWAYPTVDRYQGKHICEKPADMALDIIRASSRPGDTVCDFFCGSGTFVAAAAALDRVAIGCDLDPHWAAVSADRVRRSAITGHVEPAVPGHARRSKLAHAPTSAGPAVQVSLFAGLTPAT